MKEIFVLDTEGVLSHVSARVSLHVSHRAETLPPETRAPPAVAVLETLKQREVSRGHHARVVRGVQLLKHVPVIRLLV